ncbi:hypothetical protein TWF679_006021 [Orbilia oligospora]|uniref:Heterokaryon incompatibility domain-containing protein n=1 Tax=Orbilia oligospora TaxID=2813651 RepID=A0A8H8VM06_ORBOL|nr:hypothetical protein TWF679_006021 [Orbilia oligospora]
MVERKLLASPYRSPGPASLRSKSSIGRQGIYSPMRTPSPHQPHPHHRNISDSFRRSSTPIRPPLYRHDQHIPYTFLPDTPEDTPPSRPGSSGYGSHLATTPPLRAVRSPSPLLFSSPATPASTPGPHASRKDRRTTVRVAHISECHCTQFKHQIVTREPQISGLHPGQPLLQWAKRPIQKHVAVSWTKVQINEIDGTAISYTWGDFDRENLIIGHWEEDPMRAVAMNLGTEWDVEDLIDRLVEISAVKGNLWMDQLCAPQREDYAKEILPKIPDIFRSMEVVVLMPGARCTCLEKVVDKLKGGAKAGDVVEKWLGTKCHNKAGLSSYTNRMWARQEFRYAQNLRLVWNRKTPAQCFQYEDLISGKADISAISGYATALFMQKLHEGFDLGDKNGHWLIRDATDKFARDLRKECDTLKQDKKDLPVFFRMLLGMPLERVKDADENPMFELTHSLRTFCRNLRGLAYGTHMATNPKDLVFSVWVDLPGYKMPEETKFYNASELLGDAVNKLEEKHHVTLSTHAPAGLFKESPGGCWRPETFLANKQIKEVRDLYSTLSEADSPLYMRDGRVPLQITAPNAIGRRSFIYRDLYKDRSLEKVGPVMSKVVKNFDAISQIRLGALWHQYQERLAAILEPRKISHKKTNNKLNGDYNTENFVEFMAEYYFFDNLCNQNFDEGTQLPWETLQEVDHYNVIYKLTCYLLGLDHEFCKKKGLELIIAPEEPSIIGLTNRVTVPSWLSRFDQETLTISTSVNRQRVKELPMCMLELKKNGQASEAKSGEPEYIVTGSWVSCQEVGKKDLGGIAIPRDVHSVQKDGLRTDGWLI